MCRGGKSPIYKQLVLLNPLTPMSAGPLPCHLLVHVFCTIGSREKRLKAFAGLWGRCFCWQGLRKGSLQWPLRWGVLCRRARRSQVAREDGSRGRRGSEALAQELGQWAHVAKVMMVQLEPCGLGSL